ncbi:RagB/SusD family nutrient uptake outer membrane protein [Sphingobacterium psychroaquaticum]|uniref:RagB/SusD family nutrient uptake outer membrane protein n=1 Tax=Sphingobacterium psychroaquaticum TaxID=561061 RepID=UPI00106D9437|nr:RagB/SusD family nutrient uptake outer membrane protein [Sphingobacterium psychroaquaticum]QBQ42856.1 RagB/SusD family nutrient uptake outer membrane protein [Sphingobacterium psychroaquaticum]
MKHKNNPTYFILGLLSILFYGCDSSFLDREPLDQLSTSGSLSSTNELRLYLNQFYQGLPSHPAFTGGNGIAFDDAKTDNMIFTTVDNRLNGQMTVSNATAIDEYKQIRSVNFFIKQSVHAKGNQADINQYLGEAYFFRAWHYFTLVKKYGDVSWVNTLLNSEDESTYLERDSRVVIVDSILSDLDRSINLLKVQANNSTMRVHRDVALSLKSRVALYEGTWQRYHKLKNTPFFTATITEDKIKSYLTQARDAAKEIIDGNRWRIYSTGKYNDDYRNMFNTADLSNNGEVMLYRKHNPAENIGHGVSKYLSTGGGDIGLTQSLVGDYLTYDGKPFTGALQTEIQKIYGQDMRPSVRDPRLAQTAVLPQAPLRPDAVAANFPPINQSGFNRSTTGYPLYKYVEYTNMAATTDDGMSAAPVIYFRYAEVLLNYAEALAELQEDPTKIIEALRPLRARINMPDMDFDREYNASVEYPFSTLSKYIQAVRRERRVEMVAEGTRLQDIFRWAAADQLIVGKRPLGILFTGSNIVQENTTTGFYKDNLLYYDTAPTGKSINFYLTGNPGDATRYMDPYKSVLPNGYRFRTDRDYLLPIQQRMIELTNGKWKQNPNW